MITFGDAGVTFPDNSNQPSAARPQIFAAPWSRAGNALTIVSQAYSLTFKTSLTSGAVSTVTGSPAALTIPSGATLGTVSAVKSSIVVAVANSAGTLHYAVQNLAGGSDVSEAGLISTAAISAGAAANNVWYSNTALTNVPYAIVARIDSTQATAGTWASDPTLVQGVGGQALSAMSSLGYGQTWQSVTRTSGTTYYNTTGKPIQLMVTLNATSSCTPVVNGVSIAGSNYSDNTGQATVTGSWIIPPSASYSITITGTTRGVFELR